jgi:hypothetical protein
VLAIAALLTPFATPYGLHIVDYYREFVGNQPMKVATTEWDAPAFPAFDFFQLYLPLAGVLALLIRSWIRRNPTERVLLGAVTATALAASVESGSIVWCGMTTAVLIADLAKSSRRAREPSARFLAIMGGSGLAIAVTVIAMLASRPDSRYESVTSAKAITVTAAYAATNPCALILADNWDASALLWHYPSLAGRVGFDARLEQFPPQALMRWLVFEVGRSRGWTATTRGYELLVGDGKYTPGLVDRLANLPGASVLARDSRGIAVLTKDRVGDASGCAVSGS